MIMRAVRYAHPRQVGIVQAGQYGHRDDFGVLTGGGLGIFHHRAAAGCVNCDNRGLEHVDRLHRGGDRVGDVMQFQV